MRRNLVECVVGVVVLCVAEQVRLTLVSAEVVLLLVTHAWGLGCVAGQARKSDQSPTMRDQKKRRNAFFCFFARERWERYVLHRCSSFFIYLKGESSRNLNSLPSLRQMLPALAASLAFAPPGGVARATAVHRSSAATMGFLDGVKASPPASLFSFCSDDTRRSVLFADNLAASVLSLPTRASGEAVRAVARCAQTITSPPRLSTVFFTFSRLSYRESNTRPLAFPTSILYVYYGRMHLAAVVTSPSSPRTG